MEITISLDTLVTILLGLSIGNFIALIIIGILIGNIKGEIE